MILDKPQKRSKGLGKALHSMMQKPAWTILRPLAVLGIVVILAACAETQVVTRTAKDIPFDGSASMGQYKIGKPYQVAGTWYYPKEDYGYTEQGVASWYGPGFHGKSTANGEGYDQNAITAAHRTLPLPSLVRVTNLENGRSLVVRVNDRGPYSKDRIIDMSRRSAQLLGFLEQGTARVRVDILPEESRALKESILAGKGGRAESLIVASVPKQEIVTAVVEEIALKQSAPAEGGGSHWIQAGAFSDRSNAEKVRSQLQSLHSVSVSSAVIQGRTVYRVRIGPFQTVSEADQILPGVQARGFPEARVIIE